MCLDAKVRIIKKTGGKKYLFFSNSQIINELLGSMGEVLGVYFVKNGHTILFFYLPSPVQFCFNQEISG